MKERNVPVRAGCNPSCRVQLCVVVNEVILTSFTVIVTIIVIGYFNVWLPDYLNCNVTEIFSVSVINPRLVPISRRRSCQRQRRRERGPGRSSIRPCRNPRRRRRAWSRPISGSSSAASSTSSPACWLSTRPSPTPSAGWCTSGRPGRTAARSADRWRSLPTRTVTAT